MRMQLLHACNLHHWQDVWCQEARRRARTCQLLGKTLEHEHAFHAGAVPTSAKAAIIHDNGATEWVNCTVLEAGTDSNTFKVLLEGGSKPEEMPRSRLYFLAEDPFVFARRYAEAVKASLRAEALMRYSLFVDSMPMEDIPPLTNEQVCGALKCLQEVHANGLDYVACAGKGPSAVVLCMSCTCTVNGMYQRHGACTQLTVHDQ